MKTRLLILMSMLVAAPVAAQDGELEADGEVEAEAEMSADVDGEAEGDAELGGDSAYESDVDATADDGMETEVSSADPGYATRSITLPSGTLRIDLGPADRALLHLAHGSFTPVQGGGFTVTGIDGADAWIDLRVGAAFGIIDGLEAGAIILPLGFAPDGRDAYGDPSLYARYRILDGDFQLGAQVTAGIPVQDFSDFGLGIGIPVKLILGESMALNTGAQLGLVFADDTAISLTIPVEFAINLTPSIFAGIATGLVHPNFDGGDPVIPAGVFAGYTIGLGDGMLLDASVDFRLPALVNTADGGPSAFDIWQLTVGAVMRMNLM